MRFAVLERCSKNAVIIALSANTAREAQQQAPSPALPQPSPRRRQGDHFRRHTGPTLRARGAELCPLPHGVRDGVDQVHPQLIDQQQALSAASSQRPQSQQPMKRLQEKSLPNERDEGARRGRQREGAGSHRRVVALECLDDERHLRRVDLELPRQQRRGVAPRHQPGLGLVQRDRALLLPRVQALHVPQLSFRQPSSSRTLFLEVSLISRIRVSPKGVGAPFGPCARR